MSAERARPPAPALARPFAIEPGLYEDDEIAFTPPPTWSDHAVLGFTTPNEAASGLFVTREALRAATVRDQLESDVAAMRTMLPELRVVELREREIAGQRAAVVRVASRSERGIEQLHVYFPAGAPQRTLTLFVFEGPDDLAFEETVERTLASVRFGEPGAARGWAVDRPSLAPPAIAGEPWRRYEDAHLRFEVPWAWEPSAIVAFVAPLASSPAPDEVRHNLLLTREPLRDGATLRMHALRSLEELRSGLDRFLLLERRERVVAERLAIETRFRWRSPAGPREQTIVHLEPAEAGVAGRGARVATLMLTEASRPPAPGARAELERLLRSVRVSSRRVGSLRIQARGEQTR